MNHEIYHEDTAIQSRMLTWSPGECCGDAAHHPASVFERLPRRNLKGSAESNRDVAT